VAALWSTAAAAADPAQSFPRSGPLGDPELDGFALPLPDGWSPKAFVVERLRFSDATIPAPGKPCGNVLWFDYVPAVTVDYARRLVDTESLDVTTALRHWTDRQYSPVRLADHPAVALRSPEAQLADRTIYLVPGGDGVLVVQVMSRGKAPLECVGLHESLAALLVRAFYSPAAIDRAAKLSAARSPPPLKEVQPVPRNLEECFAALEKTLRPEDLEAFRAAPEGDLARYHLSLGMSIRNRWGLWNGSPLQKYFRGLGVRHPDDMSGIILTSFWRHLHGKPQDLDEQVEGYRRYWDSLKKPGSGDGP
jgi:hypothetical protein